MQDGGQLDDLKETMEILEKGLTDPDWRIPFPRQGDDVEVII